MNKQDLQKQLLEEIKPGIKPSDIKKGGKKPSQKVISPSPIVVNQDEDEGYISEEEEKNISTASPLPNKEIKELQKQVNFWSKTADIHLKNLQLATAKITNLEQELKDLKKQKPTKNQSEILTEKNKQIEIIAKENEKNLEKIKKLEYTIETLKQPPGEINKELQAKIKEQEKTISELKNQTKNTVKDKETPNKTFFCDNCQLTKQGNYTKRKVDAPFEPRLHGKTCYLCSSCSPYVKELSEPNFDKENNPYRIN